MGKRFHKRKDIHLSAEVRVEDATFTGFIEDVSESGVGYLITSSIKASDKLVPGSQVEVNFQFPSGGSVSLNCQIIWTSDELFQEDRIVTGMKIINPPREYRDWILSLDLDVID